MVKIWPLLHKVIYKECVCIDVTGEHSTLPDVAQNLRLSLFLNALAVPLVRCTDTFEMIEGGDVQAEFKTVWMQPVGFDEHKWLGCFDWVTCVHWVVNQPTFCWDVPRFCAVTIFADEFLAAKSQRQARQWRLDGLMNSRLLLCFCQWWCFYWLCGTVMNWGGVWNIVGTAASTAKSEPCIPPESRPLEFRVRLLIVYFRRSKKFTSRCELMLQKFARFAGCCCI